MSMYICGDCGKYSNVQCPCGGGMFRATDAEVEAQRNKMSKSTIPAKRGGLDSATLEVINDKPQ